MPTTYQQLAYQQFVRLLYEAHDASDAVDMFDLHSEIPESRVAFDRLEAEQRTAFVTLVEHVREHAEAIIESIAGTRPADP